MKITRRRIETPLHERSYLLACSDVHLGAASCDLRQLRADLDEARARGARIVIIGDLFDLILPKDHKRFSPGAIVSGLRDRDDQINAAVEYGLEILTPYADLIDMISLGNHELACIRFHSVDPVRLLLERLNSLPGVSIAHGGYCGYLQYITGTDKHRSYTVLYHHGRGGESAVTKGMIDINRTRANWLYHLFLFGHKHHQFADKEPTLHLSSKGKLEAWESLAVQCGGYRKTYAVTTDAGEDSVVTFEEMVGMKPKPLGGTFVWWRWTGQGQDRLEHRAEV